MNMADETKAKILERASASQKPLVKRALPQWFLDYLEALKRIDYSDCAMDDWNSAYDTLFGEEEWQDTDIGSIAHVKPIDFPIEDETKRKAYETILRANSFGLDLNTPIFHYTTSFYLSEAIKRGGFFLAQPKDWSHNWEDAPFKNYLSAHKNDTTEEVDVEKICVDSFLDYSYAMCWTLDDKNQNLIEKKQRDKPSDKIIIIASTVRQLLGAYITDNISVRSCFIVPMEYISEKELRKEVVDPLVLGLGDLGMDAHHASISVTASKYAEQNEVRLLVENSSKLFEKEIIHIEDNDSGHGKKMMIKHIDIQSVINSVREADNGIFQNVVDLGTFLKAKLR